MLENSFLDIFFHIRLTSSKQLVQYIVQQCSSIGGRRTTKRLRPLQLVFAPSASVSLLQRFAALCFLLEQFLLQSVSCKKCTVVCIKCLLLCHTYISIYLVGTTYFKVCTTTISIHSLRSLSRPSSAKAMKAKFMRKYTTNTQEYNNKNYNYDSSSDMKRSS